MADEYTEVTTTSWGGRILNSFKAVIFGLIMFIIAFPVLWWNEGRSVDRMKTLEEGRNLVVPVAEETIDPQNEGALIHISGTATTDEVLQDDLFGVQKNALKLGRVVEMYQWEETKKTETKTNMGGSETKKTTYRYEKVWSPQPINSSGFKHKEGHENPPSMPYQSQHWVANNIHVGAFQLSSPFVQKIDSFSPYALTQDDYDALADRLKQEFVLNGNGLYKGDLANASIGDIRVHFRVITPTEVSVIGKQDNGAIKTYFTKHGDITLLEMRTVGAASMFQTAEDANTMLTWGIRVGGFILMWVGLMILFNPLKVMGDVVPLIGSILGAGIGLVTGLVALLLSIVTMALAWIFFRPLIGGILLAAAAVVLFGGIKMLKNKLRQRKKSDIPVKSTKNYSIR